MIIYNKRGCHALYLQFRWICGICGVYQYDLKGLSKSFSLFLIGSAKSFSWRGWVKGISSLPDRVFSLWLCLFSPRFSVCTNYFRTAKIHICTVAAALENKSATSSFVAQKFYVWMWRINRHCIPAGQDAVSWNITEGHCKASLIIHEDFVSHDLWEHMSHILRRSICPSFIKLYLHTK